MSERSQHQTAASDGADVRVPDFRTAFRFWLKLGFISFGGPTGQIALMHTELVERRRWVSNDRFLHALNFCMLLPGPEATQLAIYLGWLWHRTAGGLVAGILFVLPSAIMLWVLSLIYVRFGDVPWLAAIFAGLKPAVVGIVAAAMIRIGRKALHTRLAWALAACGFVGLFFLHVPFPALILGAGIIGWVVGKWRPHWLIAHDNAANGMSPHAPTVALQLTDNAWRRTARVLAVSLVLWWLPVLLLALWLGREHTLVQQGIFFSKAALVTFGGAYAVLPYVAKQAVEQFGWLSAGQMLDGLGLAETTPGPLIMVLQFVGFLGGWQHPGALAPWLAATLGAAITTWTTFVPCFLWIFLGAPYLEQLRNWSQVRQALTAVTSAVVGVVLNLAVWFGGHVLLPEGQLNLFGAAVAVATFAAMARSKVEVVPIVFGAALAGLLRHWLF